MDYRRLGRSGLQVSPLCLGTMNFGETTGADEANEIVAHAARPRDQLHRHGRQVRRGRVGAHGRHRAPEDAHALDSRHQGRERDDAGALRRRSVASVALPGLRRQPAAPSHRLHRHLLRAQGRRRHAPRGDGRLRWAISCEAARSATSACPISAGGASRRPCGCAARPACRSPSSRSRTTTCSIACPRWRSFRRAITTAWAWPHTRRSRAAC